MSQKQIYNLFLTVEALEDDIYQLMQSFEEEQGSCRFGLIRPCFYKSFYKLVNSVEAVKQNLLEQLSIKSIDHTNILQLFHKVCVLESDLHSLLCVSPKSKSFEHLYAQDFSCKLYKKWHWQEYGGTCLHQTKKYMTQSSQTFCNCLFHDTLSEPSSESSRESIYVGKYPSSETRIVSKYEPNLLVYDRDYYIQSKPTCKNKTCMDARKSKTILLLKKPKQISYNFPPKYEERKYSDISVNKKSKRKSKKLNTRSNRQLKKFDVKKSQSANLGVYSKKKPQQDIILVRESPSSETILVSEDEPILLVHDRDYYIQSKPTCKNKTCMGVRKSKTKHLLKKKKQISYNFPTKYEKRKYSDISVHKKSKRKSKKLNTRSKRQLKQFDVKKSQSTNLGVSSKKKPQQDIIVVRESPSSETSIVSKYGHNLLPDDRDYIDSKTSAVKVPRIDIRKSKTKYLNKKHQLKKLYNYTPKKEIIKQSDVSVHRQYKSKPKKHKFRSKRLLGLKRFDVKKSNSTNVRVYSKRRPQQESHIYFVRWTNDSPKDIFGKKITNPKTDKYYVSHKKKTDTSSEEVCVHDSYNLINTKCNLKVTSKHEVKRSHYNDNHYTHQKPSPILSQLHSNESNNTPPFVINTPQSVHIKSKRQLLKSKANASQHRIYSSFIPKKNGPFNNPFEQNTNNDNQLMSTIKSSKNEMSKLSSDISLKGNEYSSELNNHRVENSMEKHSAALDKDYSVYNNYNQLIFTKNSITTLSQDKSKLPLNQDDHKKSVVNGTNYNENGQKDTVSKINQLLKSVERFPNHKNKLKSNKFTDNKNDKEIRADSSSYINNHVPPDENLSIMMSPEDMIFKSITVPPKILNINKSNVSVLNEKTTYKDTTASVSLPLPQVNVPRKKKTNNKSQRMSTNNQVPIKQNEEPLVYSLQFSKEKRRTADVSPMCSLSLSDISTSICKPVTLIEELYLSEHKFNGKEIHKKIHKYFNHLEENERNKMAARSQKNVTVNSKSQKDMSFRNHNTFRDCKNIHRMSGCSASLDWKTIAHVMKE